MKEFGRLEARLAGEKEQNSDLQRRVRELMAAEAVWKADRDHSEGLNQKLEEARMDLRQEREENTDLRRKAAAFRDLEADLREEKDHRQSLERKLQDLQRDSVRVADAVAEASQLRAERDSVNRLRFPTLPSLLACLLACGCTHVLPLAPLIRHLYHALLNRVQLTAEVDHLRDELFRARNTTLEMKQQISHIEVGQACDSVWMGSVLQSAPDCAVLIRLLHVSVPRSMRPPSAN